MDSSLSVTKWLFREGPSLRPKYKYNRAEDVLGMNGTLTKSMDIDISNEQITDVVCNDVIISGHE